MTTQDVIQQYTSIIGGVTSLFSPFLEVAIHDVKAGKIAAIYNTISNRKVGDPSPIGELHTPVDQFPDVFEPYYEVNWDGKKIKCTTVTVRDENKKPIALICFNFDTSIFQDIQFNLNTFLTVKKNADNPVELFNDDWQAKIDIFIASYFSSNKLINSDLSREQKQAIVEDLSKHGVFFYKNAPSYVAKKLHISRATIYNYLKVLRATS